MDTELLLFIAGAALAVGLAKGGLGGAFGGIITPVLSFFISVQEAVGLLLPLLLVGDVFAMYAYWGAWNKDEARQLLPPAIIGVVIGTYLLASLSGDVLRLILGVMTLVVGLYKLIEPRLRQFRYQPRPWHPVFAGSLTGIGSSLANAGGPPLSAYLLLRRLPPRPFMGTTTLFFAVVNLVRLPGIVLAGVFEWEKLVAAVTFVPLVWIGIWMGRRLIEHIHPLTFERLITASLIIAGLILFLR